MKFIPNHNGDCLEQWSTWFEIVQSGRGRCKHELLLNSAAQLKQLFECFSLALICSLNLLPNVSPFLQSDQPTPINGSEKYQMISEIGSVSQSAEWQRKTISWMHRRVIAKYFLNVGRVLQRTFEELCMGHCMSCGVIKLVSAAVERKSVYSLALCSVCLYFCTRLWRLSSLAQI